ncbi:MULTISPECIES: cysteine desulfurase [Caldilinea]|jgi:cysteine desulfurase/selenocysteine lyase|uniref:cysteine desulfurase n=1 Tax=Caldilinea aerophila (strain DSM 14535 / JCM 11387 / NBRC 104270 / STL-6-O1) TaxID=926550 RepID=I0I489_CALAS|nr:MULTISPECIES: cysteine desulfurase [Caldilinea]MBO9394429.1 cysteine desulfurase [Caldilinea sp.]BAM00077.1 putative cysteine desulfurase/selenocysteine lyase [Caldilinea aerophila DSM 14535 = NBRC 104270]GIV73260.1 MAG: cysteine desulfurase [Caldilinea sp.]
MQVADRTTALRNDFPILQRVLPNGRPLVYLDNAASSQKPECVIRAMDDYYRRYNANVHRGVHTLSEEATAAFEAAREKVAKFIHAPSARQIVFTRGTTEGINLVAYSWGRANLGPGDEVLITEMEHHANIVPWQIVQEQLGFTLRYVPITPQGVLDLERLPDLLTERTKLFCFVHASNVVGTINPVQELVAAARAVGAKVLIDGAQSVPHMPVDVQALDADFYVFSGHKMCGPTGVGVLYAKRELLEAMPPFMGGGDMIREVKMTGSKWNSVPYKFEAGTPAIAEVIGLGAAVDYLQQVGMEWVHAHEREITRYAYERMSEVEGLRILGPGPAQRGGLIAFTLDGIHPHDVAAILDRAGVAVRAGHHCAQPLHDRLGVHASARASFYLYNTLEEVDVLVEALHHAQEVFAV